MSLENVEIMRRINDAYRRGDCVAMAALWDADIFIRTDPRWPEQRIYGQDAALALYRGLWESGGSDVRIEEIVDFGDRVLVRNPLNGRLVSAIVRGDCQAAIELGETGHAQ